MSEPGPGYTVVVPTIGRPGLHRALAPLLAAPHCPPREILVVDDRPGAPREPLGVEPPPRVRVLRSGGRGPAAAREAGRLAARTEWVVFLDDDVVPRFDWTERLAEDLAGADPWIAGIQGRIRVPRPEDGRRPTDAERGTIALETAAWITADMAYRADVLAEAGGFDRRFPRAYREDTDIALRVLATGYGLGTGRRCTDHPLRGRGGIADSVRAQAGNADDALMRRLHGADWRSATGEPPGRFRGHCAVTGLLAAATAAGTAAAALRSRPAAACAGVLGAAWLAATARFAWQRIAPGPGDAREATAMVVSSALIPPAACLRRVQGEWRHRRALPLPRAGTVRAVLFDRDGTLVHDVAHNTDPDAVRPVASALPALALLRAAGVRTGVVTNQPGVARGLIPAEGLRAVNDRVEGLLGPFDVWRVCTHAEDAGCDCRKPRPGMVRAAASALGLSPSECAVVGDTGADIAAAASAGARPILVPNARTRLEEVRAAPEVGTDLLAAVRAALGGAPDAC